MCSSRLGIGSFLFSTFSTDIWHLDCDYNGAKEPPKNQDVASLCIHMWKYWERTHLTNSSQTAIRLTLTGNSLEFNVWFLCLWDTRGEGAGEVTLCTVEGWQARRFRSPSPTPATYKYFLPRLKFPITCVSQYEKILNSESTGKGRIHIIMLLKKSNSLICVPIKIQKWHNQSVVLL